MDTPGHVWAGLAAMEPAVLTSCMNNDGSVAGTGNLDPSKESTFSFLRTLLGELIPLFGSSMFMAGGDEVQYDCWASNPAVVAFTKAKGWGRNMQKLESYYAQRLLAILAAQNATVMCWEEYVTPCKCYGVAASTHVR
jgi:hexosaminidase